MTPVIGFPRLWWRLIRELNAARVRHVTDVADATAHLDLMAALRAVDSFSALPDETLRELAAEMDVVSLGPARP